MRRMNAKANTLAEGRLAMKAAAGAAAANINKPETATAAIITPKRFDIPTAVTALSKEKTILMKPISKMTADGRTAGDLAGGFSP